MSPWHAVLVLAKECRSLNKSGVKRWRRSLDTLTLPLGETRALASLFGKSALRPTIRVIERVEKDGH